MEDIILQHYDELKTRRIRGSYYIVREYLTKRLKEGKITEEEFNHFLTAQGYATYRDDLWPSIEKQYGLERPEAKPIGVIYDRGIERPISEFERVYYRARGFIFVEKADEAEDLKELSHHGWTIVAGQGFSTRLMRQLFKEDGRPVLALHDCDTAGEWIYRVFDIGSRRTRHLQLWLENVVDLGLHEDDASLLALPSQPEAGKFRKFRTSRIELSALSVLKVRWNVENPVLAYTIAKMKKLGIRITPKPEEAKELLKELVEERIKEAFDEISDKLWELFEIPSKIASSYAEELVYPDSEIVDADIPQINLVYLNFDDPIKRLKESLEKEFEKIKPDVIDEAQKAIENAKLLDEDDYEWIVIGRLGDNRVLTALGV
ncbi:hypothetical protein DRP05_00710 [Archaeoglobales archaeon]|nr:MAG: hypothetical protein DRP05_00710 [Archaeoglobales archaeon]